MNFGSSLEAYDGELSSNVALASGGALYIYDSAVTLDTVTLDSNSANYGGALYVYNASVAGSTCDFSGNSPNDTYSYNSGSSYTWGTGATFTCDEIVGCN